MIKAWKNLGVGTRRVISFMVKALITVVAFAALLKYPIPDGQGGKMPILEAITGHLSALSWQQVLPFLLAATGIKLVGIIASMNRWHLLLKGQGIRFNFGHIVGSFLIGRFLGTFLPSTVGLDGYKLYDATRFSGDLVRPAAATAVEKVMGLAGIFLTFLITLPLGYPILYDVLGDNTHVAIGGTVLFSTAVLAGLFGMLFRPGLVRWMLKLMPAFGRVRIEKIIHRASEAAAAYRGRAGLLTSVAGLSVVVHFTTAAMYYFTALAVGVMDADFWKVAFASSIQIFATVLSPFTIAGEGIREAAQAILLHQHLGVSQAILSAALGFWAAEAMTLFGAVFLWIRRSDYKPRLLEIDDATPPPPDDEAGGGPAQMASMDAAPA